MTKSFEVNYYTDPDHEDCEVLAGPLVDSAGGTADSPRMRVLVTHVEFDDEPRKLRVSVWDELYDQDPRFEYEIEL